MSNKGNLRVLNPENKSANKVEIPWKTIVITSALASIAGYVGVELFRSAWGKAKKVAGSEDDKATNPLQQPMLPGAVAPGMFTSPYSQMAAMQGFPAPFQNPMVMPTESDEPPKWFAKFKEEHERRLTEIEQTQSDMQGPRLAVANPVTSEAFGEDYEEDDEDVA